MRIRRGSFLIARLLFALAFLSACSTPPPAPTATAEVIPTQSPTPSPAPSPEDDIREGDALLKQSDYEGAIAAFERALAIDDKAAAAYSGMSQALLLKSGLWKAALEQAQKGVELAPDSAPAQAALAQALIMNYQLEEGLEHAKKAAEIEPENAEILAMLALAHLGNFEYEEAQSAAEKAYSLDASSGLVLYALGRLYANSGDFGRAEAALRQAASLESDTLRWLDALGDFYLDREDFQRAEDTFARALESHPEHLPTLLSQTMLESLQKDYDAAQATWEKAADLDQENPAVWIAQAQILSSKGDYDGALDQLDKALEIEDGYLPARMSKVWVYLRQEECERARQEATDLEKDYPERATVTNMLGYVEFCAGNYDKALTRFRDTALLDKYNGEAQRGLGVSYAVQQRWTEAESTLLKALSLSPAPASIHVDLANKTWGEEDIEGAETEFRLALELNPYLTEAHLGLGWLLLAQQRSAEAVAIGQKALELDRENPEVQSFLGIAYYFDGQAGKALDYLTPALEEKPEDTRLLFFKALANRDQGNYEEASDELLTYQALVGNSLPEDLGNRIQYLREALNQGYRVSEQKALADIQQVITSIFGRDYLAEIVEDESGRKLKISIPLSQAEIEAQDYMNMMGVMIGVGSLYVPRIDPAVDQGLEVQFKRGNQEFLSVSAATETLKEVLDTTIEGPELGSRLDFKVAQGAIHKVSIQNLTREVSKLRELDAPPGSTYETLNRAELETKLQASMDAEVKQGLESDATVLELLGVISPTLDLEETMVDLYSEQVAGFYNTDDQKMYLVASDAPSANDQIVLAHETIHALQDQAFDLDKLQESAKNDDQSLAIQALIEGDASLGGVVYMQENIPGVELLAGAEEAGELESEALESAPDYIRQIASFPYMEGETFVQNTYDTQGWEGVDKLYEKPPISSEQIMHPERYSSGDAPIMTSLPDVSKALGAPWSEVDRNVMGELGLLLALREHFGPAGAAAAADGWGGDEYILLENGEDSALVIKTVWDNQDEADEFWRLFTSAMRHRLEYAETADSLTGEPDLRAWESAGRAVAMSRENKTITLAIGADLALLKQILEAAK